MLSSILSPTYPYPIVDLEFPSWTLNVKCCFKECPQSRSEFLGIQQEIHRSLRLELLRAKRGYKHRHINRR